MLAILLHLQLSLVDESVLWSGLQAAGAYLQAPTLVYHDGSSGDLDIVVRSLAVSRPVIVVESPHHPDSNNQHTPQSTVLLALGPEPLVPSLRLWRLWAARSRVLLVLEKEADVRAWLSALWRWTRAVDVVAMVLADTPEFFTWFPYQPTECSNVSTVVRLNASALYPQKIEGNLHNCRLVAVTTPVPPITVVDDFVGIEPRLFHDLTLKVGMSAAYARLPANMYVWIPFSAKREPIGGLKLLWENEVDVLFGSIGITLDLYRYADVLPSHTTDKLSWFVPAPRPAPRATAIYRAFSPTAWCYVLGACGIIFVTTALLSYLESGRLQSNFLHTVAIVLCLPTHLPSSKTMLIFVVAAYIYSIHITTAYQSSLLVFLSNEPREKPIKTLKELAESNLKVEVIGSLQNLIDAFSYLPDVAALKSKIIYIGQPNLVPGMKNAILGPTIAYKARLREDRYYDESGYARVLILSEAIVTLRMSFFLSKGHPLQPAFYRYTQQLFEAGLPGQYADELTKQPRFIQRNCLKPFGIENVEGPFYLFLALTLVCLIFFLAELVYASMKKKKSPVGDAMRRNKMPTVVR